MTFVPGGEEVALGCPRGLKCWLSQGGSQAFWPVPGGSKAFFWLSKGGSEALRPVPGGSKCHVPGGWLQMAICPKGVNTVFKSCPRGVSNLCHQYSRACMPIKWNSPLFIFSLLLQTAYLNITLRTHRAFSTKRLHFSARRSTIPQNLQHLSSCLGVGRHFELLCACANVATTWHASRLVLRLSSWERG